MYNTYQALPVSNFVKKRKILMIRFEDVITAYLTARKNKIKSPDQVEFELHWQQYCHEIWRDIEERRFRPTAYTFVTKKPRPREVFASDMKTRVLHHYLDIRLRPLLEARMGEHTFNNRKGMGQTACQSAVATDIYDVSKGFTRDCWIVKLDIKGCFPNISQDIAYQQLEEVIINEYIGEDKDELLYILRVCIYSYPTLHCYRKGQMQDWTDYIPDEKSIFKKPLGVGAAIGHLIWQNAVNYYFNEVDKWARENGLRYERYVDDMYFVVSSKDFLLMIPFLRKMLLDLGARLNERKFYCQHYTKGVECLGVHIKRDRMYPNNRVMYNARVKAKSFDACVRESKVETMICSMNSYLGICKNTNGFWQAWKIVLSLDYGWWKYVDFDWRELKLVAKDGYKTRDLIIKKYLRYDKTRNRSRVGAA